MTKPTLLGITFCLLALACTPPVDSTTTARVSPSVQDSVCDGAFLDVYSVSFAPVNCAAIAFDVALTAKAFQDNQVAPGFLITKGLQTISLSVHPEGHKFALGGVPGAQEVGGVYFDATKSIELPQDMAGLAHEALHAFEYAVGRAGGPPDGGTDAHFQWCQPGTVKANYCLVMQEYGRGACPAKGCTADVR